MEQKYDSVKIWTTGDKSKLLYANFSPSFKIEYINIQLISRPKEKGEVNKLGEFYMGLLDVNMFIKLTNKSILLFQNSKGLKDYEITKKLETLKRSFIRNNKKAKRSLTLGFKSYSNNLQVNLFLTFNNEKSSFFIDVYEFLAFLEYSKDLMLSNINAILTGKVKYSTVDLKPSTIDKIKIKDLEELKTYKSNIKEATQDRYKQKKEKYKNEDDDFPF